MVYLSTSNHRLLYIPKEYFIDSYIEDVFKSKSVHNATKILNNILDIKYQKSNLNNVIRDQFQNLKKLEHKYSVELLLKFEYLFYATIGIWNT